MEVVLSFPHIPPESISVDCDASVGDVISKAAKVGGLPGGAMHLMLGEDVLEDASQLISDSGITAGSELRVVWNTLADEEVWAILEKGQLVGGHGGIPAIRKYRPEPHIWYDRNLGARVVQVHPPSFELLPPMLRGDRDIAIAAVGQNGDMLAHASDALRDDAEVVTVALHRSPQGGKCFRYASDRLRGDKEFVISMLRTSITMPFVTVFLDCLSHDLKQNREVILEGLHLHGSLDAVPEDMQSDPEVHRIIGSLRSGRTRRR